jgi:hypothetical protein
MLTVLDGVLNTSIDSAISSAVTSLADRVSAGQNDATDTTPATIPRNVTTEDEPAILTMPDAAQVTTPAAEETVAIEQNGPETDTEAKAEPTADHAPETATTANAEPLPSEQLLIEDSSITEDTGTAATDAGEVSAEVAEAIKRMHSEGRTVRSISRTLKVRELLVRFVLDANPHARKVLAAFGHAHGRLPDDRQQCSREQQAFLDQAVAGLARDGRVIPVRLALFAEMVKGRAGSRCCWCSTSSSSSCTPTARTATQNWCVPSVSATASVSRHCYLCATTSG